MPIYEYQCEQCQQSCELLVRSQEQVVCPHCGSMRLTKQWSVPASPSVQGAALPIAGTCGRPQCGSGGCQGF